MRDFELFRYSGRGDDLFDAAAAGRRRAASALGFNLRDTATNRGSRRGREGGESRKAAILCRQVA